MKFPDKHTCHGGAPFVIAKGLWRPPEVIARRSDENPYPRIYPFRSCDYCGSMHPEDLLKALEQGAELQGADWKYGWPHKFYVEKIPNPLVGETTVYGSESKGGATRYFEGSQGPHITHKFYNEHLSDEGFDDEARAAVIDAIWRRTQVHFVPDTKGLRYRVVPYGSPLPTEEPT